MKMWRKCSLVIPASCGKYSDYRCILSKSRFCLLSVIQFYISGITVLYIRNFNMLFLFMKLLLSACVQWEMKLNFLMFVF